jgi:hypothetical protein
MYTDGRERSSHPENLQMFLKNVPLPRLQISGVAINNLNVLAENNVQ